jgi:hypothetical protein
MISYQGPGPRLFVIFRVWLKDQSAAQQRQTGIKEGAGNI